MAAKPTPSCSILVVSSNVENSEELANRLITLSSSKNATLPSNSENEHIPWTISNNYYTALVHFVLKGSREILSSSANGVPAFIFVFDPVASEDYQVVFRRLLSFLENSDFEVSLAVSVAKSDSDEPTEEQQEIYDSFFSSLGFEYVNGHTLDNRSPLRHDKGFDGIPGLGRIIDSLSTVLWPSMIRKTGHMKRSDIIHSQNEEEESLQSFLSGSSSLESLTRAQEMEVLEKWLTTTDIEDEGDDTAWLKIPSNLSHDSKDLQSSEQSGFDDNFSDFVSAPLPSNQSNDNEANISRHEIEETTRHVIELGRDGFNDDDDTGRYDFSHVLAGLEAVKSKIAGIQDEHERRKAAAKVALSVAYGFGDLDHDFDD